MRIFVATACPCTGQRAVYAAARGRQGWQGRLPWKVETFAGLAAPATFSAQQRQRSPGHPNFQNKQVARVRHRESSRKVPLKPQMFGRYDVWRVCVMAALGFGQAWKTVVRKRMQS